jgi:hypothetical protein
MKEPRKKADKYIGGEEEKRIWQQWLYVVGLHGIFFRKARRKRLFNAFVLGVEAAKKDKDNNPYWFGKRKVIFDFGLLFYRYFLKQALDLLNTPQAFSFENLINDAVDKRRIA